MKPVCLPSVAMDTGFAPTRDYRRVASILRGHLREKRQRMTLRDLADMIGETSCDYRRINPDSPIYKALGHLLELGLVSMRGVYYEATDVVVRGVYKPPVAGMTSEVANRSKSVGMAIKNRHLGKAAA